MARSGKLALASRCAHEDEEAASTWQVLAATCCVWIETAAASGLEDASMDIARHMLCQNEQDVLTRGLSGEPEDVPICSMEQTPFDCDAPVATPSSSPAPQTVVSLPLSAPVPKPKKRLLLAPFALIGGGLFYAQRQNEIRAREEKLAVLRQDIKKIVLQDNALVLEMLDDGALEHITYAEFFKRAEKNKEERDVLIRTLRSTETGPYGEQVGNFVRLMEAENEWVRAEEAVSRASLDLSGKWDAYKAADEQSQEVVGAVSKARRDYEAAPYGEDYVETAALNFARSRLDSASENVKAAFEEWKEASDRWKEKKDSAAVVIADWVRNEPLHYPNFAPKRAIMSLLVKKKAAYIGVGTSGEGTPRKATRSTSSPIAETPSGNTSTGDIEPKPSPTPNAPTRVRSSQPLDGELFSQTRTDEISADYAAQLSDEDLRYAINEMFARFGMTFKDKELQSQLEGKSWYSPNERWKPDQIERAMTSRERQNLAILTSERSARNASDG